MNKKIIASVLAVAFIFSMAGSVNAITVEELQAKIAQLLTMITQLQAQIAQMYEPTVTEQPVTTTTTATGLCLTKYLSLGMIDAEVKILQQGLKQDSSVYPEGLTTGYFGPLTKSAVIRFQEKYASEVLSHFGLNKGTGYVGALTKTKFNNLYCITSTTTTTSPTTWYTYKRCTDGRCINHSTTVGPSADQCSINADCITTTTTSPISTTTTAPVIKYSCNSSTWKCAATYGGGQYDSLSTCQARCQSPATTSLPDLTISNITADKTTLNIGETTKISATEKNIGNATAGHHYTGIFEDNIETPLESSETNAIMPGYGFVINANYRCFRAGSHTITAIADFIHKVQTGEVVESNENNNSKTITINCVTPPISTTTTTSATTWYTYKRCTDGRCVNHSTTVGPSADQCSTNTDCITPLLNVIFNKLSASLISILELLKQ